MMTIIGAVGTAVPVPIKSSTSGALLGLGTVGVTGGVPSWVMMRVPTMLPAATLTVAGMKLKLMVQLALGASPLADPAGVSAHDPAPPIAVTAARLNWPLLKTMFEILSGAVPALSITTLLIAALVVLMI